MRSSHRLSSRRPRRAKRLVSQRPRISSYPTPRVILVMALGLPASLLIALIVPAAWVLGAAWLSGVLALCALDWWLAPRAVSMRVEVIAPSSMDVGADATLRLIWPGEPPSHNLERALTATDQLEVVPKGDGLGFRLTARRRGTAVLERLWLRWTGPLGLMWVQRVEPLGQEIAITVDTARLSEDALALYDRHAPLGQTLQRLRGDGQEFDALSEFVQGMDPRSIDWKHSARHGELLARDYDTEKNNQIILAYDSGYLMSDEQTDANGLRLTKLDRALSAGLLLGFLSLREGDRTGLFAFDAKPYLYVPPVHGSNGFAQLKGQSAKIDYSTAETNFTLGLTTLLQRLKRRSLVIVFSDFIDTIQSELMPEMVARLMKRHVVVFVTFEADALTGLMERDPQNSEQVAEAIIAKRLNDERELVLMRLRRMGVSVLQTKPEHINAKLINKYLELKRAHVL